MSSSSSNKNSNSDKQNNSNHESKESLNFHPNAKIESNSDGGFSQGCRRVFESGKKKISGITDLSAIDAVEEISDSQADSTLN